MGHEVTLMCTLRLCKRGSNVVQPPEQCLRQSRVVSEAFQAEQLGTGAA